MEEKGYRCIPNGLRIHHLTENHYDNLHFVDDVEAIAIEVIVGVCYHLNRCHYLLGAGHCWVQHH